MEIEHEQDARNKQLEAEMLKDVERRAEKARKEAKEKAKHASSNTITNGPTIESIPPLEK